MWSFSFDLYFRIKMFDVFVRLMLVLKYELYLTINFLFEKITVQYTV